MSHLSTPYQGKDSEPPKNLRIQNDHSDNLGARRTPLPLWQRKFYAPEWLDMFADRLCQILRLRRFPSQCALQNLASLLFQRAPVTSGTNSQPLLCALIQSPDRDAGYASMIASQSRQICSVPPVESFG